MKTSGRPAFGNEKNNKATAVVMLIAMVSLLPPQLSLAKNKDKDAAKEATALEKEHAKNQSKSQSKDQSKDAKEATASTKESAKEVAKEQAKESPAKGSARETSKNAEPAASAAKEDAHATSIDSIGPQPPRKLAQATLKFQIYAPADFIWSILIDFANYPKYFNRIETCQVTKTDGNLVYIESHLKKQMFVKQTLQHTVNDLSGKPSLLKWKMLDGNFKYVDGSWEVKPLEGGERCQILYTLAADPGPIIPAKLVSFVLHFVQKEIVDQMKKTTEAAYQAEHKGHEKTSSH